MNVIVQAHPKRRDYFPDLFSRIGTSSHIVLDRDSEGIWPTYRRCLELVVELGTRTVILQDDVVPAPGFYDAVKAAADHCPHLFSCFMPAFDRYQFDTPKTGYWGRIRWIAAPAIVWSVEQASEFLAWITEHGAQLRPLAPKNFDFDFACADWRVNAWAHFTYKLLYTTYPSLVDHRVGSTLNRTVLPDLTAYYVRKHSHGIDWSKGAPTWI